MGLIITGFFIFSLFCFFADFDEKGAGAMGMVFLCTAFLLIIFNYLEPRSSAVKKGYAHYVVVGSYGETRFEWLTKEQVCSNVVSKVEVE